MMTPQLDQRPTTPVLWAIFSMEPALAVEADGEWSGDPPTCERELSVLCPSYRKPLGNSISYVSVLSF